jgi:hypothetical protein
MQEENNLRDLPTVTILQRSATPGSLPATYPSAGDFGNDKTHIEGIGMAAACDLALELRVSERSNGHAVVGLDW